jgi:hypothetical protein
LPSEKIRAKKDYNISYPNLLILVGQKKPEGSQAMGERNSLCERIRNARANLANAEQSFQAKQDVRGELDLMLAEAEMQNLRKRRSKRMLWTRQLLAGLCAVLVLLGGYGGWLWAQAREKEIPEVTAATAAIQVQPGSQSGSAGTLQAGQAANAPPAAVAPQAAATPEKVATVPVAQVQETPAAPARQTVTPEAAPVRQVQSPVSVQTQTKVQLSSQQLHQLVRSGRQTLNSSK